MWLENKLDVIKNAYSLSVLMEHCAVDDSFVYCTYNEFEYMRFWVQRCGEKDWVLQVELNDPDNNYLIESTTITKIVQTEQCGLKAIAGMIEIAIAYFIEMRRMKNG